MNSNARSGYILLLSTFIIATSILLISFVVSRVATYRQLTTLFAEKEKAKLIAHSGLEIAISQLMVFAEQEEGSKKEKAGDQKNPQQEKKKEEKSGADFVLEKLNKWQSFDLTEKNDGLEATCKIYITSEQGKINLNALYDFAQSKYKMFGTVDGGKVLQFVTERIKPVLGTAGKKLDLAPLVEKTFKQLNGPLEDISQLLMQKESEGLNDYLFPSEENKERITLFDLFTVAQTSGVHPLVLTPSIKKIAGLGSLDKKSKEKPTNEQIENIIGAPVLQWEKSWKPVLELLHAKDYAAVPEQIKSLFANQFESNQFFVVSYGKVGSVTEKIAAVIEKKQTGTTKEKPFVITKLYWL